MTNADGALKLSIILPCLNEESAIGDCLESIHSAILKNHIDAEIIVVDNGSSDNSIKIIESKKYIFKYFSLFIEKRRGYGAAYMRGLKEARGEYIFMADADNTYDFGQIPEFLKKLEAGADLIVGNRFSGTMEKKSMPWLHRNIGNPFLSLLVKKFFKVKIGDIHCGARAISKKAYEKINLNTQGMEFASEMIIKAAKAKLIIAEIPVSYRKRTGESKLRSFRDGWRHLRFILIYSPIVLFLIPGSVLFIIGGIGMIIFYAGTPSFLNVTFYIHPMFLFSGCIIAGYQLIYFAFFARIYAITHMQEKDPLFEKLFKYITIEKASILGIIFLIISLFIYLSIFLQWIHSGFSPLNEIKNSIVALTLLVVGIETISSAFMLSIIGIQEKRL